MARPASIVTFERCYLGAWVIGLINTLLHWGATVRTAGANPALAQLGPSFGVTMLAGSLVIGVAITLLLWYFVARRGSVVAKWIVTVFFAIGLVAFLFGLLAGRAPLGVSTAISVVVLVLQGLAVAMLFRADTKPWFGEMPAAPGA